MAKFTDAFARKFSTVAVFAILFLTTQFAWAINVGTSPEKATVITQTQTNDLLVGANMFDFIALTCFCLVGPLISIIVQISSAVKKIRRPHICILIVVLINLALACLVFVFSYMLDWAAWPIWLKAIICGTVGFSVSMFFIPDTFAYDAIITPRHKDPTPTNKQTGVAHHTPFSAANGNKRRKRKAHQGNRNHHPHHFGGNRV